MKRTLGYKKKAEVKMGTMTIYLRWLIIIIILFLSSCASIGPRQMRLDKNRYNDVIRHTDLEQMLANIVRLRYLEDVSFTKTTNVTSSYTLNPSVTVPGTFTYVSQFPPFRSRTYTLSPQGSLSYSDTPTISYAPINNSEFNSALLTPISLEEVARLYTGGISNRGLLAKVVVSSINYIDNAPEATDPYVMRPPKYREFYHLQTLVNELVQLNGISYLTAKVKGNYTIFLHFYGPFVHSHLAMEIKKILNVSPDAENIYMTEDILDAERKNTILIRTRSVLGIMSFLSHGVQVPREEEERGFVPITRYPNGEEFNWFPLMHDVFIVYCTKMRPDDTYVSVYLNNHWFSIMKDDLPSKATFLLVNRLFTLTTGQKDTVGPLLTLPVHP